MPTDPGTQRLEAVLAALDPERKAVADALRAAIRSAGPDLTEDVKWNAPVWSGKKLVFCLMVYDRSVHLGFWHGAELAPHHPAIVGTGKSLRHIRIPTPNDAAKAPVRAAIRAAIRLDAGTPATPRPRPKR
ncbi:MAG: DUF1801 domain-containing protein [Thermoplasmata archaeon]|nr:DUF1801 domain-containing protein [Thermoplasmata archaeon]